MKTIYSLKEFRNEVLVIAALKNEKYTSLQIDVGHDGKIVFKAYVSGLSWVKGDTMEDCLQNLKDAIITPPIKDIDVEIEMPEPISETIAPTPTDDYPF